MVWFRTGCLVMMAASMAVAVEFHVAPRGSATGTGSAEFPFGTLERAREAVAEARRQGLGKDGVIVWVHGGRYERHAPFLLGMADGGSLEAPVVYRGAPGEKPLLSGAKPLPLDAFSRVTDQAILKRLPVSARKKTRVVNLKAFQITDYGRLPVRFRGGVPVLELFYGGKRMELARWPNRPDWAVVARIVDRGSTSGDPEPKRPGVFKYADPRHARWSQAKDLYLNGYWCYDWFEESIRVGAIDPEERTVTLAAPHGYGIGRARSARRYYAFNLLEELDRPGEYYLDRDQGLLYFWPPKGTTGPVHLSMLAEPLIQVAGASDLRLEGLTFEHVRGGGLEIRDSQRVRVAGCTVRHTGGYGISVSGGEDCRVDSCDVYDIGTGGVLLKGGDPKTLTPCRHRATNNHIHHFARRQRTYAGGLHLSGVGLRADHNLIHDAPHSAILGSANDCLIEYNEIHDVCLETDDCGAFYKGRNPAWQGNVLRYNFWHHVGTPLGHGNNAIYFDDGDVGETVFGNVFYKAGRSSGGSMGAIFTHGGHANTFENNVFVDCDRAIGHSHWSDERWRDYFDPAKHGLMKRRLVDDVDITKAPYTERYPSLKDFFSCWQRPRLNVARNNVAVRCKDFLSGEEFHMAEANLEVTDDPGFVNARALNFLLKPDSPVFAKLPGFKPIPFALIGLKRSALRAEWPVAHLPAKRVVVPRPEMPKVPLDEFAIAAGVPPVIDGVLGVGEWSAANQPLAVQENLQGGRSRFPSRAWLRWDGEALFVAFENRVSTAKPLVLGNDWGRCDAVEVAMAQGSAPIAVLRGYPTGHFESSPEASKNEGAAKRAGQGVGYSAKVISGEVWVCEWRIPWAALAVKPQAGRTCHVNLSVRKTATNEWTMLRATGGSTWKVSEAAILRLAAAPEPKPITKPVPPNPPAPKPEPPKAPKPMPVAPPVKAEPAGKAKPPAKLGPLIKDDPPVQAVPPKPEPPKAPKPLPVEPPLKAKPSGKPKPPVKLGPLIKDDPPVQAVPPKPEPPKAPKPAPVESPVKAKPAGKAKPPVKLGPLIKDNPPVQVVPPKPEPPKAPPKKGPVPVEPPVQAKPDGKAKPPVKLGPLLKDDPPAKVVPLKPEPPKVPEPAPMVPPVSAEPAEAKPPVRLGPLIKDDPPAAEEPSDPKPPALIEVPKPPQKPKPTVPAKVSSAIPSPVPAAVSPKAPPVTVVPAEQPKEEPAGESDGPKSPKPAASGPKAKPRFRLRLPWGKREAEQAPTAPTGVGRVMMKPLEPTADETREADDE